MSSTAGTPFHLVIPAAGIGSRFGSRTPKQYACIEDKPLIHWAIAACLNVGHCQSLTVALAADDSYWQAPATDIPLATVSGGKERADSVLAALEYLQSQKVADDALVLVHDAARPYVPAADIAALLAAATNHGDGAILAAPVADTLKLMSADGNIESTVDRSRLWRALTPQAFPLGLLLNAMRESSARGQLVTDEASAVEYLGGHPQLVKANAANIKVTLPEDLQTVAGFLASRREPL